MLRHPQQKAIRLYREIKPIIGREAVIIALEGPLGAGKTIFTKAFARAMGIKDPILSPTFTLHSEYGQLDHIDLWRIDDPQELLALGLEKMVQDKKVIIIEWAEKARDQVLRLSPQTTIIWIKFEYGEKENERRISYESSRY